MQQNDKNKGKVESRQLYAHMVRYKKNNSNNKGKGNKCKFDDPKKSNKNPKDLVCCRY